MSLCTITCMESYEEKTSLRYADVFSMGLKNVSKRRMIAQTDRFIFTFMKFFVFFFLVLNIDCKLSWPWDSVDGLRYAILHNALSNAIGWHLSKTDQNRFLVAQWQSFCCNSVRTPVRFPQESFYIFPGKYFIGANGDF